MNLEGGKLDVAVAKALGLKVSSHPSASGWWVVWNAARGGWDTIMAEAPDEVDPTVWSPSAKWEHGGPIIEREGIAIMPMLLGPGMQARNWVAHYRNIGRIDLPAGDGPTPLIAAMRAYVTSKQSG